MPTTSNANRSIKAKTIGFWVLKIILGLMFFGGAVFKLTGAAAAVAEFDLVGLGQWFRYFTAACEITGAILLVWPRTTAYGALLLAAVCVGAFVAQLEMLHGDVIHTIVFTAILGAIAWVHRDQVLVGSLKPVSQS